MVKMYDTAEQKERVVIVGLITGRQDDRQAKEYLDELEFLVDTSGAEVWERFIQRLDTPHPATFVGSGKLKEIADFIRVHNIETVVFDDELSPTQIRNIEPVLQCKILDRTNLILDIFANRAQTAHSKTQVELAQCKYMLPRLTRLWSHLERQQGGIGTRGPGESQIETDKRIILDRISFLKAQLEKIDSQMMTQRRNRGKVVRVALVAYTNVGKSTILNLISKSEVFAENKLFATLDTTVRKVVIGNLPFLLTDTVGFIRKLPHHLVESFKSTLDETREADLLIHVVDISHPGFESQVEVVNKTLADIGASDKPMIYLFNKIDAFRYIVKEEDDLLPSTKDNMSLEDWKQSWMGQHENLSLFISATEKINIEEFKKAIYEEIKAIHIKRFPYNDFLYQVFDEE
ncbi:MAG: GTPase HflX [Bacteroidia bacterium]|nr:GTPase HflX [Bacteroidia bacterium]